jgi:CubicO group peptidase (beta-lactamase class C family)/D-alanyl-D-alanine dipeptidase
MPRQLDITIRPTILSRHLLLIALLGIAPSVHSAEPEAADGYEALVDTVRAAVRYEVESKDLPAFSIALVEGDTVVWADGFGFQDAQRKSPATAETVYRVGSVSKLFTDMAVMQLVEQGRLDLDAPVREILPGFAPTSESDTPITLRQLMSHRAGLVRECPVGNYFDPDEPSVQATIASLNNTTLVYPPGTRTKYSNSGITVVGATLEARAGRTYSTQIEETILQPLGMTGSSFVRTPPVDEKLATAWMWTYDGRRFEAPKFSLGIAPAGNLYASVLDLSKFLVMLLRDGRGPGGPVVTPETLQEMTTPLKDENGKPQSFGIGFHVGQLDGQRTIGHNGAVYGFSTQLEALPERNIGVVAVSSLDGSNGVVGRLAEYALRLLLARQDGKPLPEYPRTGTVPPDRARPLVGTYRNDQRLSQVTELNGRLYLKRGVFRYELRAAAADGSIMTDDAIDYGTPVKLDDAGDLVVGDTTYKRFPDELPAEVPGHWKGLIGEYGWDHNTLYILEDHGRLVALIEWFYYYPLTELGPDEFAFPDYGLYHDEKLRFMRDADGQATQVVAADVTFQRRAVGTRDGETFRITPVRPIAELRDAALAASPPPEAGEFRESDLVELTTLDPTLKLDVRYATTNNFTGTEFYRQARAFMQRPAAEALVRAHQRLKSRGLGLLIHDAYRPWHVTRMFWDATPEEFKDFVANPANGSRHNRGCAVDLTLYDLTTGVPIQMVAGYDEFSPRSFPGYPGGTSRQRWHRDLLRTTMEAEGFTVYEFEWWHFDYRDWKQYRIGNVTFEEIGAE